ncbi:hypothetical protein SETIT_6G099700v2 [Setaria italica]|uniref:Uncharacterized protein n=1 Tax=Setaria italica TaxID=4555 RepID=A0A368RJW8_SETIT|nr:hypothetical protein SETIT_6G099700v2 [Setaria italica]
MPQLTSSASTTRMQKDDHPFPGFFYLGASLQPCHPLRLRLLDSGRPWDKEEVVATAAQRCGKQEYLSLIPLHFC